VCVCVCVCVVCVCVCVCVCVYPPDGNLQKSQDSDSVGYQSKCALTCENDCCVCVCVCVYIYICRRKWCSSSTCEIISSKINSAPEKSAHVNERTAYMYIHAYMHTCIWGVCLFMATRCMCFFAFSHKVLSSGTCED
jgi:hypothetical protein